MGMTLLPGHLITFYPKASRQAVAFPYALAFLSFAPFPSGLLAWARKDSLYRDSSLLGLPSLDASSESAVDSLPEGSFSRIAL